MNSSGSSLMMISMLSLFESITCSLSIEEINLLAIFIQIFHVSGFLKLFSMSFKYGLVLLRYSLAGKILFLSLFRIQCTRNSKIYLLFIYSLVYNNFLLHAQKDSQYPLVFCL